MDNTYTVKLGDTLSQIGQQYGLDYNDIASWNGISDPGKIWENQQLKLYNPNAQQQSTSQPQAPQQTTAQGLVGKITDSLQPQTPYDQVMPYDTYAAPQMEVYNQWLNQMAKPEFNQYTLNPFQEQYANSAAAGGASMMGNGAGNYQQALKSVTTPFENQIAAAQSQYEDMVRQGYNQQQTNYYNSPLTNFNYQSLLQ